MSQPRPTDPIGSIEWTERTGGVLTARECLTLARPLLRGELSILAGRLAMVLRIHSGRRSSIDPASLVPPDSALARDAEGAAQDLLTPALRNHSSRAYTWGAAIAALHGITFDRELLYLAAMSTTPGSRARCPTSTSRFAAPRWHASSPTATTCLAISASSLQTRSPCTTHPALASNPVPRPTSYLPAQPSMCSAYAATRYPMPSARASSGSTRGWALSGSSPGCSEPRPSKSLVAAPGTCTALPSAI